ncbi:spermatogenesis-associated serine-rich protein 2 [Sphaerodactylus townsendi]|uniref:spermatogenesis-associated serine-rich protein 2 n=1 Tax=Sphaerodactylus townsendi TaxID=933632 RepID=UPI002026AC37|nr:spermatogenesis-associated serine-rich protein 2 [Sphaerodactylus townsendi]XP_048346328.1 spermatogenesis-associated serine-rich protein 2 [Sphaerodactylus townsendi]XP_048346329.1 spermatogenesis-associated serine-rich protein 2 [Sphaerodactylus townsendi]XP_048346330.1 spermatogenesis-associated serine-rich protein 2 [Sphaerodactylus townsendi]XP_048346331.1 spermatogenesis-associated serine-rich protein 2 [Sphaerodactylus townsendi]
MSKKQNQKDSSGFIFDVQSNTVMAQGGTFENMKEKISAVRAIVPNRSNNEIILVLQHFDNCVDRTVQAFMEGSASAVLKEWTVTGKKKNKKKKPKPKPPAESSASLLDSSKPVSTEEEQSAASSEKGGINGYHFNGSANDTESVDSLSEGLDTLSIDARELEESDPAALEVPNRAATLELENRLADFSPKSAQNAQSLRVHPEFRSPSKPFSRSNNQSTVPSSLAVLEEVCVSSGNKKLGSNIEKSVKDLQRCTVSLARYRVVVKEEMDASIKKMKQAFAELQSCLMDREVALLGEMDKVKAEAMEILSSRQKRAGALKKLTDVAVRMSEEQLVELRADIKHFVSERKYDEDLGRVARFTCDLDELKRSIESFGQVSHPKNSYSTRSRCSSITSVSVSSPDESTPTPTVCASASAPSLTAASKKPSSPTEMPASVASRPYQPYHEGFQGNRRPGQGYRAQGQRPNGALHSNSNRYRNRPWYQSSSRSRPPPGNTNHLSQTYSPGTNGTGTGPGPEAGPPASNTQAPVGSHSKETKALPQRKPRSSQNEGANS